MSQLSKTVVINRPIAQVWSQIADVGLVKNWHPVVAQSPVLSPNPTGVGAMRRCEFYDGTSVVEEVTEVDEGTRVKIALSEFSMPLNTANAEILLTDLGDEKTQVEFIFAYEVKYGPVGWLMNAAMIRPMMNNMFEKVLGGLKHHVETGEYIGQHGPTTAPAERLSAA